MNLLREKAKQILEKSIFDYIDGAAGDEWTSKANCSAFQKYCFRPRVLRNVSKIQSNMEIFGTDFSFPLMLAPTACHKLVEPKYGEISTAEAALSCGVPMVLSCMSSMSAQTIAQHPSKCQLWQQLYIFKDRSLTVSLIDNAQRARVKALMLTVGVPLPGHRIRDEKNKFTIPVELLSANLQQGSDAMSVSDITNQTIDSSICWDDILWLKEQSDLPIILKGILSPEDAIIAYEAGIDGIVVSNHGGRQLDGTIPSLLALTEITKAVGKRIKVILDGGVRQGSDIFKAYCLGADAVMIGRPVLWALALNGALSLKAMLHELRDEFTQIMQLCGCRDLSEIRSFQSNLQYVQF